MLDDALDIRAEHRRIRIVDGVDIHLRQTDRSLVPREVPLEFLLRRRLGNQGTVRIPKARCLRRVVRALVQVERDVHAGVLRGLQRFAREDAVRPDDGADGVAEAFLENRLGLLKVLLQPRAEFFLRLVAALGAAVRLREVLEIQMVAGHGIAVALRVDGLLLVHRMRMRGHAHVAARFHLADLVPRQELADVARLALAFRPRRDDRDDGRNLIFLQERVDFRVDRRISVIEGQHHAFLRE